MPWARLLKLFSCGVKNQGYQIDQIIGVPGAYGKVYQGKSIPDGKIVAIKRVSLSYGQQELDVFRTLQHRRIVRYIDSYTSKKYLFIVMEKCEQDLFDVVVASGGRLVESVAVRYIVQILEALQYLHSKGIVHGDIKLSNILLDTANDIKVIDFGTAQTMPENGFLTDFTGSVSFLAPEVIQGGYNTARDMWSLGCVAFILLFGYNPFNPSAKLCPQQVCQNILKGFGGFPNSCRYGKQAKDFIVHLLVLDWRNRMTAQEALQHPWIRTYFKP